MDKGHRRPRDGLGWDGHVAGIPPPRQGALRSQPLRLLTPVLGPLLSAKVMGLPPGGPLFAQPPHLDPLASQQVA